ncbi:hypothetical protein F511_18806 [Dorcoceras hygrometricum]|uniref:Uncharacterized protein n=1 Tax=Dorcoceras hygrometricum TaxID=472368 RepID=A0A2Z7AL01_9LAMI|nr:hypothetical protein F511_18806 [Dorcoceras hygrometricum]
MPEHNLEEKSSRHNDAGDSPDDGRTAAAAANIACGASPHAAAPSAASSSAIAWRIAATNAQHHAHGLLANVNHHAASARCSGRRSGRDARQGAHVAARTCARGERAPPHAAAAGRPKQILLFNLKFESITDSACKNQLVVVSVQYGPFNPYNPIRSTTIGKSRVAKDPIAMHTSWRSNSDIASVTSIGYPRMSTSGESSTTMHRLLHASGSHPIPPPNDPKFELG